jgi:dipeptidyl aminopeptidase/acylaminoacyl peptidase
MKAFFIIFSAIHISICSFAQKPLINSDVYGKWTSAFSPKISDDGDFVSYHVGNGSTFDKDTLIIQSTNSNSKRSFLHVSTFSFSENNKYAIFQSLGDSLGIVLLTNLSVKYISNVKSFKSLKIGKDQVILYLLKDQENTLVLFNLSNGNQEYYSNVIRFTLSSNGKLLLLERKNFNNEIRLNSLECIDLKSKKTDVIWEDPDPHKSITNLTVDADNKQLAFILKSEVNNQAEGILYYYSVESKEAKILIDSKLPLKLGVNLKVDYLEGFSKDGRQLFFTLKEKIISKSNPKMVGIDIWSYADPKLQSLQLKQSQPEDFSAMIQISNLHIIEIGQLGDQVLSAENNNILVLRRGKGDANSESNWNKTALCSIYLFSTLDGTEKLINKNLVEINATSYKTSPNGEYIVYFDPELKSYFSYEIATAITRNLASGVDAIWTTFHRDDVPLNKKYETIGIAGFKQESNSVFIYDQSDIWQIDLAKKKSPINITNGYGKKNNIIFRFAESNSKQFISDNRGYFLRAFDRRTKKDGFYYALRIGKADPTLLIMQPYVFMGTEESDNIDIFYPIKALNATKYIVRKMSASESPNFFLTTDFKNFKPISTVYPEKKYNWLKTELITWETLKGDSAQGILYKPENFDPTKKYPIIFYYYERISDQLNRALEPAFSLGQLNIPYYVSNGYLVFTPDLKFTIGEQSKSVYEIVVSAAKHLGKLPYIDSTKMGLQGHSRGGYETNILISKTNIFAAACSASGFSDLIDLYGAIREDGTSRQSGMEIHYQRIGSTLWDKRDLFIKNSPIFNANNVNTPLLMMNNIGDTDIPFTQGTSLFTALRRLGKKAWMLQYDGEDHILFDKASEDFTIRMKQFFDFYLMNRPAPKWMVEGIPASRKGIDDGLELEPQGVEPVSNLLVPEEQRKVDSLSTRKPDQTQQKLKEQ